MNQEGDWWSQESSRKPSNKLLVSMSGKAFKGSFDRDASEIPSVRKNLC